MDDYRRDARQDSDYSDTPDRETEEIRDEMEDEDDEFDEEKDVDEDDEDDEENADLGKSLLDLERGAPATRGLTDEIGSEGGSSGGTEVEREPGRRRVNAGEETTIGGAPADDIRFGPRRDR